MPENSIIKEIIDSENTEHDIKEQIYDAIKVSEDILGDLKEKNSANYQKAKEEYNSLRNEIIKAFNDDKIITRQELKGLKDEIDLMYKNNERSTIQKGIDSVSNYFDFNENYKSVTEIEQNIEKINQEPPVYFFENPESIKLINNGDKLDEVLNYYVENGKKIDAKLINEELFNEFILKPGVELDFYSYQFISKENLENNLNTLLTVHNQTGIREFILLEACKKEVNPDTIKNVIKLQNINIEFLDYIKIYLGEKEVLTEEDFDALIKNNNIKDFNKLDSETQRKIIDFLSKNINNPKYEEFIVKVIEKTSYYADLRLLDIKSVTILKALIGANVDNIRYITNEKIKDIEIIDCFLDNLKDRDDYSADDILWDVDHINRNFDNLEGTLHIFNYIKNNIPNRYNGVLDIVKDEEYLGNIINLYKNSKDLNIKNEYLEVYNDLENIIDNDLNFLIVLNNANNEFNVNNKNMTKGEFRVFTGEMYKKLEGLDNKVKNDILIELGKLDGGFGENSAEKILSILKTAYPDDYKTNPEFKKYFNIIHDEIKNFNNEKIKSLSKSIDFGGGGGNKYAMTDENGKTVLNEEKIEEDYSKLIEGKDEEEIIKIKEKFINDNFDKLSEEDKMKVSKILDLVIQNNSISFVQENFEQFVEYTDIKEQNPDVKMDFKKYVEIKPKLEEENNNFYITSNENYIPTDGGYSLKGKNGETIDGLVITEEEKKLTLGNPEATENLINFYDFFKKLNLKGVWEYRKELLIAIGDANIDPNDADSIKDSELRIFGNNLLTFIANLDNKDGNNKKVNLTNIDSINNELKKISGADSSMSDSRTFNIKGEGRFTAYLRSRGIIGGAYFHVNEFRKYL